MSVALRQILLAAACLLVSTIRTAAQSALIEFSPGGNVSTLAGDGTPAHTGDHGPAAAAGLAYPVALAMDVAGNLYIADEDNHCIRRIDSSGNIETVAGNGEQGFSGDGGLATAATLNRPSGVAIGPAGEIYIADSGNHRVRMVSNGVITTFSGNGTAGHRGDNGTAAAASLNHPRNVAVDSAGNLYIADTGNHVIRIVTSGVISTLAGNGEQGFSGDSGPATAAMLDTPTAVAPDNTGAIYIADSGNRRVRVIRRGTIATSAGSGVFGYAGDAGSAIQASLSRPAGLFVDEVGALLIADADNHVIRKVWPDGTIVTLAGDGEQGFLGDDRYPAATTFDTPGYALSRGGVVYMADRNNHRIRQWAETRLDFAAQVVGTVSAASAITITNRGVTNLLLSSFSFTSSAFALAASTSCAPLQMLVPGSSCVLDLVFAPSSAGTQRGQLSIADNALGNPHTIVLSGNATRNDTSLQLSSSVAVAVVGQPLQLTATVAPVITSSAAPPTGSVLFRDGTNVLGSATLSGGSATLQVTSLTVGSHNLSASYAGDALYNSSPDASLTQRVVAADFSLSADTAHKEMSAGESANFTLEVASEFDLSSQATLLCTTSSPVLTCAISPPIAALDGNSHQQILTVQTSTSAMSSPLTAPPIGALFALMCTGLVVSTSRRRALRGVVPALALLLAACGNGTSPVPPSPPRQYTVTIAATASVYGNVIQKETAVTVVVR
jgi:Big-like domain-containing protein/NHL repeat-containing protein